MVILNEIDFLSIDIRQRPFFENSYQRIQTIAQYCHSNDIEFVLFVAPRHHHWSDKESPNNWEFKRYGSFQQNQNVIFDFFDGKMERAEFSIINMLGAFRETDEFPLVFDSDPHWNEAGMLIARIGKVSSLSAEYRRLGT